MITKRVIIWALFLFAIRVETLLHADTARATSTELPTASPEKVGLSSEKLSRVDSAVPRDPARLHDVGIGIRRARARGPAGHRPRAARRHRPPRLDGRR